MNNIRWKDNGIFFTVLACLAITLVVGAEMYVQSLDATSDGVAINVEADAETDSDEGLDANTTLTPEELKEAHTTSERVINFENGSESFTWKIARSEFPRLSPGQWLEVAKILYEQDQFALSQLIYESLLQSTDNIRTFEVTKDHRINALFQLARIHSQFDRYDAAITNYQQVLSINPNHQLTLINLGLALQQENRHLEAVEILTSAAETNPGSRKGKALAAKGSSYMELGDYIGAQGAYEQSILYRPRYAPTYRKLAEAKIANHRSIEEVLFEYNRAISLQKKYSLALHNRARYYWKIGDISNAKDDLETALGESNTVESFTWTALHLYIYTHRTVQTQDTIKLIQDSELSDEDRLFLDALITWIDNDVELALTKFNSINNATYQNPWVHFYRASAYSALKDHSKATAEIQLLFDDFWLSEIAQVQQSQWLRARKDFTQAEVILKNLQQKFPTSPFYAQELGDFYIDFDRPELAIPVLQNAITLTENTRRSWFRLAYAFSSNNETEKAIAEYTNYLQKYPSNKTAHYNLATLLSKSGRTEEAIDQYRQALEIDQYYTNALNNLSLIYRRLGRFNEANEQLDLMLEDNANDLKARDLKIEVLKEQQNYAGALEEVDRLLALTPNNTSLKRTRSDLLRDLGRIREAVDTLLGLPKDELVGNAAIKLYNLGLQALDGKELALAEQCFEKVLSVDSTNHKALVNLTVAYNRGNKFEQTVAVVAKHQKLLPQNYKLSVNLAAAHFDLGHHKEVVAILQPLENDKVLSAAAQNMYQKSLTLLVSENAQQGSAPQEEL